MGTDTCEQNCHNTVGSYTCSCNAGYTLNSDGHTCDGIYVLFLHVAIVWLILKGNWHENPVYYIIGLFCMPTLLGRMRRSLTEKAISFISCLGRGLLVMS